MTRIALAVPYHSRPELLTQTLRSVVAQTDPNWECIVCDDSGESDAESIVQSFGDARLSYRRNPRPAGMVANWRFCLQSSEQEWLTLLHADDELCSNYVEIMRRAVHADSGVDAYHCRAEVIDAQGQRVFSFPDWIKPWLERVAGQERLHGEAGVVALLHGNFIMCPTMLYRRERALEVDFNARYSMAQDLDFYFRLLCAGGVIARVDAIGYRYRRHNSSASAEYTRDRSRFDEELEVYDLVRERCRALGWHRAEAAARGKRILRLHLAYLALTSLAAGRVSHSVQDVARLLRI